jgi:hypothetical protein
VNKKNLIYISKILSNALKDILVPIAFIMYGWNIYSKTKSILLVLNISLALLIYLLIVLLVTLRRNLKLQKKEIDELWQVQENFFKSLYTVIETDPCFLESEHKISLVEIHHNVKKTHDYVYIRKKGQNIYDEPSDALKIRLSADSPIDDVRLLKLHARDKKSGAELHTELMKEHETLFFKPYKIYFKSPLAKDEDFDVEINYVWPGAFTKMSDYVAFVFQPRLTEIEKFKSETIFDFKIALIRLYKIQQNTETLTPQILSVPLKQKDNRISFEIDKPNGFYFLQWVQRI